MRFACTVAAFTLAIAFTVCRALPVDPYRRNLSPMQFVQHALMHENSWTLVLRERVRVLPPIPYKERFKKASAQILGNQQSSNAGYLVRSIVINVLDFYEHIGTFVKYAANVLHRCLTCFVYKHLVFQSHYVIRLFVKGVNPDTIMKELNSLKDNIVVSIDKLAVVPAELQTMFQLYWEVARLMQYDVMHHMRFTKYPKNAQKNLEILYKEFKEYLVVNCTEFVLNHQFFNEMDIPVTNLLILDNVLNVTVPEEVFLQLGRDHALFFGRYLRNLGYESMPRSTWGQIFYYSEKLPVNDELDQTNVMITHLLPGAKTVEATEKETSTTEPTATEPTATEPTATEPTATEPTATEPAATEPTATETAVAEPTAMDTAVTEPAAKETDTTNNPKTDTT